MIYYLLTSLTRIQTIKLRGRRSLLLSSLLQDPDFLATSAAHEVYASTKKLNSGNRRKAVISLPIP
jgi:hypothetical protein